MRQTHIVCVLSSDEEAAGFPAQPPRNEGTAGVSSGEAVDTPVLEGHAETLFLSSARGVEHVQKPGCESPVCTTKKRIRASFGESQMDFATEGCCCLHSWDIAQVVQRCASLSDLSRELEHVLRSLRSLKKGVCHEADCPANWMLQFGQSARAPRSRRDLFPIPYDVESHGSFPAEAEGLRQAAIWGLNALGNFYQGPLGRAPSAQQKRVLHEIESSCALGVKRLCTLVTSTEEVQKELFSKHLSYTGEEVAKMELLTAARMEPGLPPLGHGGAIPLEGWLSSGTRWWLGDPARLLRPDWEDRAGVKKGRIHVAQGEVMTVAELLVARGVCEWIPSARVAVVNGKPLLNGLFGVGKSQLLEDGSCVLRTIMNFVPLNNLMEVIPGAINELPNITQWLTLVVGPSEQVFFHQSDMSAAFYLFEMPKVWRPWMCFDIKKEGKVLSCRVLPMGWSSSVGIMQELSSNILQHAALPRADQVIKGSPLPPWFCQCLEHSSGEAWWQVYLDNFVSADKCVAELGEGVGCAGQSGQAACKKGEKWHLLTEQQWEQVGILSSAKKRVSNSSVAEELGAFFDGEAKTMGISPERTMKLIHSTLLVLHLKRPSRKLVQIVLGRWVFAMQFRRPGMAIFSEAWELVHSRYTQKRVLKLKQELWLALCLLPLLHSKLDALPSNQVTCSDASLSGGAVAVSLKETAQGQDLKGRLADPATNPVQVPILVISLFNGIGGAFRAYDIAGVTPLALVAVECHKPANRVTQHTWPATVLFPDVMAFGEPELRLLLQQHPKAEQVHLWGGFPCKDLSSAKFGRQNLEGSSSSLFYELLRVWKTLKGVAPPHLRVFLVAENVASMDVSARDEVSAALGLTPFRVDPVDAVNMSRPRLIWTDMPPVALDGVALWRQQGFTQVVTSSPPLAEASWLLPGWSRESKAPFPTFMRCLERTSPPPAPAGIARCDELTLARWSSYGFCFPPYQFKPEYLVWKDSSWRLLESSERELLMGFGLNHTATAMSASLAKQNWHHYEVERLSLIGDSFAIPSVLIFAVWGCASYVRPYHYAHYVSRLGLASGGSLCVARLAPLARIPVFGCSDCNSGLPLAGFLAGRANHTGSDVRVATGLLLNPKACPRQSIDPNSWLWKLCFRSRWKQAAHINELELRMIVLAVEWFLRQPDSCHRRLLHLTDSYVSMSVIAKGRSSSRALNRSLRRLAASLLAAALHLIVGHVDSLVNPTDAASRS